MQCNVHSTKSQYWYFIPGPMWGIHGSKNPLLFCSVLLLLCCQQLSLYLLCLYLWPCWPFNSWLLTEIAASTEYRSKEGGMLVLQTERNAALSEACFPLSESCCCEWGWPQQHVSFVVILRWAARMTQVRNTRQNTDLTKSRPPCPPKHVSVCKFNWNFAICGS